MHTNSNIVLMGFMGTGKTSVGKHLAAALNLELVDMDQIIEQRAGKPITRIFAEEGEPHFRKLERALAQELSARSGLVIACGGGVVLNPDNVRDYSRSGQVLAQANVTAMKLEAFKYYYLPSRDTGIAGIVATPTPELLKLQADLIAAVTPFTVETGDSASFVTTPDDPIIDPLLIGYVSTFVPKASGEHFNPHVTTGVALREYLDKMLSEPFESFTFSPAGAAVYQLGQFGTAAKKLKTWGLQH